MSDKPKKKSNGYAADTIQEEGLDYAVRHYCDGSTFRDPETARLWDVAAKAIDDLYAHLSEETGRDVGNE